jgi:hypothetical protein
VGKAYGRRYKYDSVNQFRVFQILNLLPAAQELVARQRIAFEQRRDGTRQGGWIRERPTASVIDSNSGSVLEIGFEEFKDALVLIGPAGRLNKPVVFHRVNR